MNGYEKGEVGPVTRQTLDRIEDEYRARLGLPPRREKPFEPSHTLIAMRDYWKDRNDR